jgi:hypothetical protein
MVFRWGMILANVRRRHNRHDGRLMDDGMMARFVLVSGQLALGRMLVDQDGQRQTYGLLRAMVCLAAGFGNCVIIGGVVARTWHNVPRRQLRYHYCPRPKSRQPRNSAKLPPRNSSSCKLQHGRTQSEKRSALYERLRRVHGTGVTYSGHVTAKDHLRPRMNRATTSFPMAGHFGARRLLQPLLLWVAAIPRIIGQYHHTENLRSAAIEAVVSI